MDMPKKGMASAPDMKMMGQMQSKMATMMKMMAECAAMCKKMMGENDEYDAAFKEAAAKLK